MPINPSIPLSVANIPPVQIPMRESPVQSLTAIAPGINAMRQLETSRFEMQEKKRQRDALTQMRQQNLDPEGVAQWFMSNGTPEQMQFGMKMLQAAREEKMFRQAFGGQQAAVGGAMPQVAAPQNAMIPAPTAIPAQPAAPQPAVQMVGGKTREELTGLLAHPQKNVRDAAQQMLEQFPKPARDFAPTEIERLQDAIAQLPAGDPRRGPLEARIARLTAPPTSPQTTIKLAPQESAEQKGRGERNVELYKEISDSARLASRTLPAIETQRMALERGFTTQWGGQAIAAAASLLGALGVPEAKQYATDAQTFTAALNQTVLQRQLEQKGVQTQADADRIQATGAQLGNTVEANKFILDVAKAQAQRDLEQRKFFDDWWRKNKSYEGAEDAWYDGAGGKSLFERPELRRYAGRGAAGATPTATQPTAGNLTLDEQRELEALRRRFGRPAQ
jgi:hypothetical protein